MCYYPNTLLCACCARATNIDCRLIMVASHLAYCYPCYQQRRLAHFVQYVLLIDQLLVPHDGGDTDMLRHNITLPLFSMTVRGELFSNLVPFPGISPEFLFMTPHVPYCLRRCSTTGTVLTLNWVHIIDLHTDFMDRCQIRVERIEQPSPIYYNIMCDYMTNKRHKEQVLYTVHTLVETFLKLNTLIQHHLIQLSYQWDQQ